MRLVPRSESWMRNVLASRLTETTLPSNCRVSAEAAVGNASAPAAVMAMAAVFMGRRIGPRRPATFQHKAKRWSRIPAVLPTGTVTLLFTDIEGSTVLLREVGDRYGDVLADHHRLLRDVWARHDGAEVDTEGDAFFVAFASAPAALA